MDIIHGIATQVPRARACATPRPCAPSARSTARPPERGCAFPDVCLVVPAAAYRKGLLDVLAMDMAIRTRRVGALLGAHATGGGTATQSGEALRRALPQGGRPTRSSG
jgi:hypothetical protein